MKRPPHGIKRSDPVKLAKLLPAAHHPVIKAALSEDQPLTSDLTPFAPKRKDQGMTSSCTAHAATVCLTAAMAAAGVQNPINGSPHVLYSLTGEQETPGAPLQDNGRQLADVLRVMSTVGVTAQKGPTPDGRESDVWSDADTGGSPPGNVNTYATADEVGSCSVADFIFGQHTIDPTDPQVEELVVATLTANPPAPILLGTVVGTSFEQLSGDQAVGPADPNDPNDGGHALGIFGHRTMPDGSRQYRVLNSWGEGWDENGECWVTADWLKACWELHPMTLSPR